MPPDPRWSDVRGPLPGLRPGYFSVSFCTRQFMPGDDDQIVPIADSALLSATLLKNGPLKVYEKLAHTIFAQALDRSRAVTAVESMGYTPRHRWGCRAAGGSGPTRFFP